MPPPPYTFLGPRNIMGLNWNRFQSQLGHSGLCPMKDANLTLATASSFTLPESSQRDSPSCGAPVRHPRSHGPGELPGLLSQLDNYHLFCGRGHLSSESSCILKQGTSTRKLTRKEAFWKLARCFCQVKKAVLVKILTYHESKGLG